MIEIIEKTCSKCGDVLTRETAAKSGKQGLRKQCKPCWAAYMRSWTAKNPEKIAAQNRAYKQKYPEKYRDSRLRTLFGITAKDYDDLFSKQRGCCAVCGVHNDKLARNLAVDHDHKTDEVRGLLCATCNGALGVVNDDISLLKSLINYLEVKER